MAISQKSRKFLKSFENKGSVSELCRPIKIKMFLIYGSEEQEKENQMILPVQTSNVPYISIQVTSE